MSLRGKEVRPFIGDEFHEKLVVLADNRNLQLAEAAARFLEKAIAAEWHELSVTLERSARIGKRWKAVETTQTDLFGKAKG